MSYFEPKSTWSYYCKNCGRSFEEHQIVDHVRKCPIRDNSNQMARRTRKKEDMNIPEGAVTPPVAKPEVPLATQLKRKIAGQDHVVDALVPYYEIWKAGLSPEGRPAGIFFLLGPTGTGKTALVEALAEAVHGSSRNIVKIDCGEYQMEHEVAKLIGCFTPDTKILLFNGMQKRIDEIAINDMVITRYGQCRPVTYIHRYEHNGDMIRLNISSSNIPLNTTPGHKILAIKGVSDGKRIRNPKSLYDPTKLEWVHAEELKKHDIVAYPRYQQQRDHVETIDLTVFADLLPNHKYDDTWIFNGVGPKIRRHIKVDENFVRLAGYYVAEGGVSDDRKNINFTMGVPHKQAAIDDVLKLIPLVFGEECVGHVTDRRENHSVRIYAHSRIVAYLMAYLFGNHAVIKQLPDWFVDLPESLLWNFLDAAIMGDGGRTVKRRVQYDTVSELLYSQMQFILRTLGITSQTQVRPAGKENWRTAYRIYIAGDQITKFAEMLPIAGAGIDTVLTGNKGIQRMSHVDEHFVYFRVTETERFHYEGPVYDFSVDDHTSYVAGGITVSNSPPGYLGHRETVPRITQNILTTATSGSSNLSIVLFDEIEKAASSMVRLLLGVLDKSTLRLGDNAVVNFDRTFIFFTSNVGSTEMAQSRETWGFGGTDKAEMKALGTRALRRDKKFSTEFLNRVDEVLVYEPLTRDVGEKIAQMELVKLQAFLEVRKGAAAPRLIWGDDVVRFLGEMVTDLTTGAREMKRYIHRGILKEVASLVGSGEGGEVVLRVRDGKVEVGGEEVGRAAA
jgi:intein/homing endonuclease